MNAHLPARKLTERPDLDQLKRQAKELLDAFAAAQPSAMAEVREYYRGADPARFALHDAQLVLARAYGFESWPKLKARVDGVTVARLHQAVEQGDLSTVQDVLRRRPELVNREQPGHGERRALHIAVQHRDAAMTRVLMEHGANPHIGIWPYRKDTRALTMAEERGYDEIVSIVRGQQLKRHQPEPAASPMAPAALAVIHGEIQWILNNPVEGEGLLTLAVKHHRPEILALLLERGFDPDERTREPGTDEIVYSWGQPLAECTQSGKFDMAEMLLARDAWACVWNAYRERDSRMIELLGSFGGVPNAATPGYLRDTALAARMFAEEAEGTLPKATVREGKTAAEEVLDPAASAGAVEILRMALERIDWPRDDPRWFGIRHDYSALRSGLV